MSRASKPARSDFGFQLGSSSRLFLDPDPVVPVLANRCQVWISCPRFHRRFYLLLRLSLLVSTSSRAAEIRRTPASASPGSAHASSLLLAWERAARPQVSSDLWCCTCSPRWCRPVPVLLLVRFLVLDLQDGAHRPDLSCGLDFSTAWFLALPVLFFAECSCPPDCRSPFSVSLD